MTIGSAIKFINTGLGDELLRERLNGAKDRTEFQDILAADNYLFSDEEFDHAYYQLLTQCQEEEDADQLKEFKMWWDISAQLLSPETCGSSCSGCCPG